MATLNAAVQQMIDKLHAALAAGTLTAEEQLLISKALEALTASGTWEQALVAVAEQHLNTGTTALAAALALLDASKATLDSSRDVLNAQLSNLALLPTVADNVISGKSNFLVSRTACDVLLTSPSETNGNLPKIVWTVSLDDYETGVFTSLSASHDNGGAAANPYVSVSADGVVQSSLTSLQIVSGTAGLLPSTNGTVRLFNINAAYSSCTVYVPQSNAALYTFPMAVPRLYLDPATRIVYTAYAGKLYQATDSGAAEVAPAVSISTVTALDSYAGSRGWTRVDGLFASVSNSGISSQNSFDAASINTTTTEVSADVGAFGGTAYSFLSFNPAMPVVTCVERILSAGSNVLHITSDSLANTGYYCIRSALLRTRFRFGTRKYRELDVIIRPRQDAPNFSRSNSIITPTLMSVSFMHNAVIVRAGFVESSHGAARTFTGLSFGR